MTIGRPAPRGGSWWTPVIWGGPGGDGGDGGDGDGCGDGAAADGGSRSNTATALLLADAT
jgi:hypothetical protein